MPDWKILILLALCLPAACRRDSPEAAAGAAPAARQAATDACIGRELLARAQENLATLAGMQGIEDAAIVSAESLPPGPMRASFEYAGVYHHHAVIRHAQFAYADSAQNHARTPADSARYAQRAAALQIAPPEAGTVEANVAQAYARDYTAIRNDEDHPCNWNV